MWKRKLKAEAVEAIFFCGSEKNLPLPLPHRLFNLKSNLAKKFCQFPIVDYTVKLRNKSERTCKRTRKSITSITFYIDYG